MLRRKFEESWIIKNFDSVFWGKNGGERIKYPVTHNSMLLEHLFAQLYIFHSVIINVMPDLFGILPLQSELYCLDVIAAIARLHEWFCCGKWGNNESIFATLFIVKNCRYQRKVFGAAKFHITFRLVICCTQF